MPASAQQLNKPPEPKVKAPTPLTDPLALQSAFCLPLQRASCCVHRDRDQSHRSFLDHERWYEVAGVLAFNSTITKPATATVNISTKFIMTFRWFSYIRYNIDKENFKS
eukprot:5084014-Amphidinium_carterae.1